MLCTIGTGRYSSRWSVVGRAEFCLLLGWLLSWHCAHLSHQGDLLYSSLDQFLEKEQYERFLLQNNKTDYFVQGGLTSFPCWENLR